MVEVWKERGDAKKERDSPMMTMLVDSYPCRTKAAQDARHCPRSAKQRNLHRKEIIRPLSSTTYGDDIAAKTPSWLGKV